MDTSACSFGGGFHVCVSGFECDRVECVFVVRALRSCVHVLRMIMGGGGGSTGFGREGGGARHTECL